MPFDTMISNLPLMATLFASSALTIMLIYIPSFLELKRPHDAGPRLITDDFTNNVLSSLDISIENLEQGWKKSSQPTVRITTGLDLIENLET